MGIRECCDCLNFPSCLCLCVLIIAHATAGDKSHCGDNRAFRNGACHCDPQLYDLDLKMYRAYSNSFDQCSGVYTQGYCPPGFWLTPTRNQGLFLCWPNPCAELPGYKDGLYVLFKGKCRKLNESGKDGDCKGAVKFSRDGSTAICSFGSNGEALSLSLPSIEERQCGPGQVLSSDGNCYFTAGDSW